MPGSKEKLIFIDRDGVINKFPGRAEYVTRWEDFHFLPNSAKAIELLNRTGHEVVVISNQGCVSRGLITLEGLHAMTEKMLRQIEGEGGAVAGVYYCIHQTSDHCACKKPQTALLEEALRGRDIALESAYFIGDSQEDIETGHRAGCRTILVLSGRTSLEEAAQFDPKPDTVKQDLWEAASWIAEKKS